MSAEAQANEQSPALSRGICVANDRYLVDSCLGRNEFYELYKATDVETNEHVHLYWLHGLGADDESLSKLEFAKSLSHRNLAALTDGGLDGTSAFVCSVFQEGHSLRQLLAEKHIAGGTAFTSKSAVNVLSHVAAALSALPSGHGCLSVDTIHVNRAGRVMVSGLGLSAFLPKALHGGRKPGGPEMAPEVLAGGPISQASDIYSLGAIAYHLLVGREAVKGCPRPSQARGLATEVDTAVVTAMAGTPKGRFTSAGEAVAAIKVAVASRPSAALATAQTAQRSSGSQAAIAPSPAAIAGSPPPRQSGAHAVAESLAAALADDRERWLISMGNLDYGPFTLAQVIEKINSSEILPGHVLIDKQSGERQSVEDNPLLGELVDQAAHTREETRRARAEVAHATREKTRGFVLYAFIAAAVLALGGGAYLLVGKLTTSDSEKSAALDSLEEASLQAKITFPKKKSKKRRKRGSKSSGGVKGGWDDSMDMDMAKAGGDERLDDSQINPVIQKHGGRLGGCLRKTGSRFADIDFIIKGTGKVSSVRVNGETNSALAKCVRGAMGRMSFPSFDGARTKANFNMSI